MSREDAPNFRRKCLIPKLKFGHVGGLFFFIPTVVFDNQYGVAIVWFFWAISFVWGKEK